jgi:hypothetical protein
MALFPLLVFMLSALLLPVLMLRFVGEMKTMVYY